MLRKHLTRITFVMLVILNISCGFYSEPAPIETTRFTQTAGEIISPRPVYKTIEATNTTISSSQNVTNTLTARNKVYLPTVTIPVKGFFASPDGSAGGNGSRGKPWDLETALNPPRGWVKPGDTIWLRGGTYGDGGRTIFNSKLEGTAGNPITVRSYPGERAVIDGFFMIYGSWSIFWGLEVTSSNAQRNSQEPGSNPGDIALGVGFNVVGPHNTFINNIVHEKGIGFGFWGEAVDSELYGNISYNNGWQAPDRGHGYGIYSQNENGTKWIRDNIVFNNFGEYTLHIYGEKVYVQGYEIDGNILFNGRMILGGILPSADIKFTNNYLYKNNVRFGYRNQSNLDLTFSNNFLWADEENALDIWWWQNLTVTGNLIVNNSERLVDFRYPNGSNNTQWNQNIYYGARVDSFFVGDQVQTWSMWNSQNGFDGNSSFTVGKPSGVEVFVRPNKYEIKRGHSIIYNWDERDTVTVDISDLGLKAGDRFVLHNAQNYFEETISGTYDGEPIRIPMKGWSIVTPVGWNQPLQPVTFPRFGVFVLTMEN